MEVTTLRLSMICRMNLMTVLNRACQGKPSDKKWRVATKIYAKIEVPEPEMEAKYQTMTAQGPIPNAAAIREAPAIEVDFTQAEIERIEDILAGTDLRPVDALVWYNDLAEQLENPHYHPVEDKKPLE
jgi:hypothetical protein